MDEAKQRRFGEEIKMTNLKQCPKCNHPCKRNEVHKMGCAYCSSLIEGEPGCIELTQAEYEALKDYMEES